MRYVDDTLLELCAAYELSEKVQEGLYRQIDYLHTWHKEILPNSLTTKERAAALEKVKTTAMELAIFIDCLPGDLKFELNHVYFQEKVAKAIDLLFQHSIPIDLDPALTAVEASVLPNIAKAAAAVAARCTHNVTGERGRPAVVGQQAHFIGRIAQCLVPAGIEPSNGGRFRAICEAVFEAACVTFPERALRYFLREVWPDMKEDGLL